jgi:hypothetical protein
MTGQLPLWVSVLAALLTPAVAVAAALIAYFNYQMAKRKRSDDLFDRRYAFYKNFRGAWLSTGTGTHPDEDPGLDVIEDLAPLADEASFLFGDDIVPSKRRRTSQLKPTLSPT